MNRVQGHCCCIVFSRQSGPVATGGPPNTDVRIFYLVFGASIKGSAAVFDLKSVVGGVCTVVHIYQLPTATRMRYNGT